MHALLSGRGGLVLSWFDCCCIMQSIAVSTRYVEVCVCFFLPTTNSQRKSGKQLDPGQSMIEQSSGAGVFDGNNHSHHHVMCVGNKLMNMPSICCLAFVSYSKVVECYHLQGFGHFDQMSVNLEASLLCSWTFQNWGCIFRFKNSRFVYSYV